MEYFLWLSDLHLDPFYGSNQAVGQPGANCFHDSVPSYYGQKGCDSPFRLVEKTLQEASVWNVSFVIVTGDICRHGTDQLEDPLATTQGILATVSQLLRLYMPHASIVPSLGNNDVTPDYYLDVDDPMDLLTMATKGLDILLESDDERATFLEGGFLARNVSDSLTILSLNTLIYSTSHIPDNHDDGPTNDPLTQFVWLERELTLAAMTERTVYIMGHIPPSMGSYRHSQLWQEPYLRKYYSIVQNHSSVIRGQFFGHLHADEFRWIGSLGDDDTAPSMPLWIASSVTPIYGSNPSYRRVSFNTSNGELFDYDTFYLDLLGGSDDGSMMWEWKQGPSFRDSFQVQDLSQGNIGSLVQALNDSILDPQSTLWQSLVNRQHVYIQESAIPCQDLSCRRAWICTLITTTTDEYATCLGQAGANVVQVAWSRLPLHQRIVVGTTFTAIGFISMMYCLCRFGSAYLRRRHYEQHVSFDGDGAAAADDDDVDDGGTSMEETTTSKKITFSTLPTAPSSSMEASYHRQDQHDLPSKIPSIT